MSLGYVGFPLANVFSTSLKVIAFDTDSDKVEELSQSKNNQNLNITDNSKEMKGFYYKGL
ncbi:hypothetical protein ACFLW8_03445 [Chloroflexota bacterium]